jgi:hypothetical protein
MLTVAGNFNRIIFDESNVVSSELLSDAPSDRIINTLKEVFKSFNTFKSFNNTVFFKDNKTDCVCFCEKVERLKKRIKKGTNK